MGEDRGGGASVRLVVDLHTHTVASGHAYSTMDEIARKAAEKRLELIAFTDHGPSLPGGAHQYHFWNLRVLPDEMYGVRVLKGAEANIVNHKGHLDLDEDLLKTLDVVAIGFHPFCGYEGKTVEENTQTLIKAMQNPFVHIVVHPGNPWFPVEIGQVVEAAKRWNVLLELNNSSFVTSRPGGEDVSRGIATAVYEAGLDIILGSDAHLADLVGEFTQASREATEIGFSPDRIMNTSAERTLEFLRSKGAKS